MTPPPRDTRAAHDRLVNQVRAGILAAVAIVLVGGGALAIVFGLFSLDNPWVGMAFVYGAPALVAGLVAAALAILLWRHD